MDKIKCDVLVVGAGPVGTVFSYVAAKHGCSVVIVDRKNEVAAPLRGGEAVSKYLFEELSQELPFLQQVYTWPITDTIIYNPVAKITTKEDKWNSYMLNRKEAEKIIAQAAVKQGCQLILGATVHDAIVKDGKITKVKAKTIQGDLEFEPKIVVGADGATSFIRTKILGGKKLLAGVKDWGCAIELEVTNLHLDTPNSMQLFMGEIIGGYGYIFPKGNDRADVGVGGRPFYGPDPLSIASPLESYYALSRSNPVMHRQLKDSSPLEIKGGIIDLSKPLHPVYGNTILVGDAANQNFAYVGEGIIPGWMAALIAGRTVAEALEKKDLKVLNQYPQQYEESFIGQEARRTVQIKDNISKVIGMNLNNNIKSVLTAMLELEMIQWDGKELPTALKCKNQKELLHYAQQLIDEKEMKIEIAIN
ncbi:MAG: NAD(P)/FAD-dependent oxidoreductase [Candidatus Thermoplasmatota archaeon]